MIVYRRLESSCADGPTRGVCRRPVFFKSLHDTLARQGLPFREAHEATGLLVAFCLQEGKDLQDLALPQMQGVSSLIGEDVYEVLALEHVVNARDSYGGTAQAQVEAQIAEARAALAGEVLFGSIKRRRGVTHTKDFT